MNKRYVGSSYYLYESEDYKSCDHYIFVTFYSKTILGCRIFAYDHTINAPPTRGNHIKYFKTGLGYGKDLKPLSMLISENNHDRVEIDYLKVCNIYITYKKLLHD